MDSRTFEHRRRPVVCIIDSDAAAIETLSAIMAMEGARTIGRASVSELLQPQHGPIDVVVVDEALAAASPVDVVNHFKDREVPVIVLGAAMPTAAQQGAFAVLPRPISVVRYSATIRAALIRFGGLPDDETRNAGETSETRPSDARPPAGSWNQRRNR